METFTQEELRNIAALISIAPITGKDAVPVALLQQKISTMLQPEAPKPEKEDK